MQARKQGKNISIVQVNKDIRGEGIVETPGGNNIGVKIVEPKEVVKPSKIVERKPPVQGEIPKVDTTTTSIQQAKASGQSFDEWVKGQGEQVFHGTSLENANKIKIEGFKIGGGKGVSGQTSGDFIYAAGNKQSANRYVSDRLGIKNPTVVDTGFNGKVLEIQGKMADFEAFGEASKKLGVPLGIGSQGKPTMLDMPAIKKAMQEQGYGAISFSDRYANGSKAYAILPDQIKTRSQLKAEWDATQPKGVKVERIQKKELPKQETETLSAEERSLLERVDKELESKDTKLTQEGRLKLQRIEEKMAEYQAQKEVRKSILEQFSPAEIRAMRVLKRAIEVRENQGKDPITVRELSLYKKHLADIMNAINTDSEDVALRYIMEELPDKLTSSLTREELANIKVYKTYVKPKSIEVSRAQLPVGEGKEKLSRLEARITKNLKEANPDIIERLGLVKFNQMNKKAQIAKASEYVIDNTSEALRVLEGKVEVPEGLLYNSIYVAMQNLAKGDVDLARKLSSLSSTRAGQEISILTELDPDSPVRAMREIIKIREDTFKRRYKNQTVKQVKDKIAGDIKSKVKKINKYDWNTFINSIETC